MRQLMVSGTGDLVLKEVPAPTLAGKPPGAILKVTHAMIGVGSTLAPVVERRAKPDPSKPDHAISYQISGVVKEVTPGLEDLKPGDPVCMPGGGFAFNADEVFAPRHLIGKLKSEALLESGVQVNVACTGLHACRRARSALGEWNVVVGLGMVGQYAVRFARLFGAYVVGSDIYPQRLELAKKGGAAFAFDPRETDVVAKLQELTGGHGADAALVAAKARDESLFESVNKMVNKITGRIVMIGVIPMNRPAGEDVEILMCGGCGPGWRDLEYKQEGRDYPKEHVRWTTHRNIQLFADLLGEGRLDAASLVTHRFDVTKANEAYTQLIEKPQETLGVVLKF